MINLDTITHQCTCGSILWKVLVSFEDFEIASYSLDMYCAECNNKAIAPTPLDHPDYQPDN